MNKNNCILVIILAIFMMPLIAFADNTTTNAFGVTVAPGDIPGGGGGGGGGGGAGVAIGVGAGAGAVAAGAAGAALAPSLLPGLLLGAAASLEAPLTPVCLCDGKIIAELQSCADRFCYLLKAISKNCLHNPCNSKYIMVSDTTIQPGSYNVVTLQLPKELVQGNGVMSVKLTQVSNPFKIIKNRPEIDSRLYINKDVAEINQLYKHQKYWKVNKRNGEVAYNINRVESKSGTVIKYGEINYTKAPKDTAILVTTYNFNGKKSMLKSNSKPANCQRYAVLLEFSNLDIPTILK